MSVSFNLVDEKPGWIPVLYHDGAVDRVSILEALEKASEIRQIAASNPMDRVAILRFLLAVLYWCKGNPPNVVSENAGDWFPSEYSSKLERSRENFNLLDPKRPFYQDSALTEEVRQSAEAAVDKEISKSKGHVSDEERSWRIHKKILDSFAPVTSLMHDLPSTTNIAHFRHTRDGHDGMCLACCALGLLRWPAVAPAEKKGKDDQMTACVNGNAPTYSYPIGHTLLATLRLTPASALGVQNDAPVWAGADEGSPLGFLKGMTWGSRRVLLAPPDADNKRDLPPGRCCHCGEQTHRLVKSVWFCPGWKRPYKEPWSDDPHLLRITRKDGNATKAKEKRIVPSWPSPNDPLEDHAGVWRSVMEGLLQRSASSQSGTTDFCTTLLGNVQALYKHVGQHRAVLPRLTSGVAQSLLAELNWLREVTWATTAARGGNWRDPPKGHHLVGTLCAPGAKGHSIRSSLCAHSIPVEQELEKAFQQLMQDLAAPGQMDGEAIVQEWRANACGILRSYAVQSVDAAKSGSPLLQREAKQRAEDAIKEAVSDIDRKKGVSK
ncbi:MAG: type I-E CRISPR-associated protein Cse1/CasA [Armatimonadetes bacterium]|nr:type I-E CRISPR-associated protein Cse1/CasA [Armatimonadota bacterium]